MSKHNRRRGRGGRGAANNNLPNRFDMMPQLPQLFPFSSSSSSSPNATTFEQSKPSPKRVNDLSALHWRNRYLAWKRREDRQFQERQRLKEEQRRIFGGEGEGEEDEELCERMLDVFSGLDYLHEMEGGVS